MYYTYVYESSISLYIRFRMKLAQNNAPIKQSNLRCRNTHNSMKFVIILANCFALLPVEGAIMSNVGYLHFRWKSFKILYSIIILLAAIFTLGTGIVYLFEMSSFEMIGMVE